MTSQFASTTRVLLASACLALCGCGGEEPKPKLTVAKPPPTVTEPKRVAPSSVSGASATAPAQEPPPVNTPGLSRGGELNLIVEEFVAQTGRVPSSLEELVEKKFIARIPEAPPGKKFALKIREKTRAEVIVVNK